MDSKIWLRLIKEIYEFLDDDCIRFNVLLENLLKI